MTLQRRDALKSLIAVGSGYAIPEYSAGQLHDALGHFDGVALFDCPDDVQDFQGLDFGDWALTQIREKIVVQAAPETGGIGFDPTAFVQSIVSVNCSIWMSAFSSVARLGFMSGR